VVRKSTRQNWESYWGSKERVDDIYSNADRIGRNLAKITDLKGLNILDVGAGTGRDSLPLTEHGAVVFQIDYSFESLRLMKQTAGSQTVTLVGGDTFRLPFREGAFDLVFHQGLLEHFKKQHAAEMIHEQVRVLKDGGMLLVDVPQRYHIYTVLKHIMITLGIWFAGWERSFSYPELLGVFRSHGLEPVYSYGEWMRPSLLYRGMREMLGKVGVRLPLNPPPVPILRPVRDKLRDVLVRTSIPLYTGICIGIVGRKGSDVPIGRDIISAGGENSV
jgi:SAM-dependent methyltransferase